MELVSVSIIQDNLCFEHTKYVTMGIVLVFLNLSHNWILTVNRHLSLGLNRHGLLIRPCLKTLVFLHLKQKTVQRKKDVEILNKLHCKTLSLKQLIKKPPKKFCKQKISDCIEERITLTNDYILPMKRSMCYLVLTWFEVSHEVMLKRKKSNNLLQSEHAGLTSFRWPVLLNDQNFLLQLLYATHQGFAVSQRTHLTQVSITLL